MASNEVSLFAYAPVDSKKEKSANALRTISEAAEILDVPQHVLRFWETKFTQIKPLKRNGGRRFYRPQDLDVLQQIKHLLYNQGYTIKGAKKAVDEFIHARADREVSTQEWLQTVPPANVNDNFVANEVSVPDMLAEIAEALNEPEPETPAAISSVVLSPDFAELRRLRAELVAIRDALRVHAPAATAVAQ